MPQLPEATAGAVQSFIESPAGLEGCADILLADPWLEDRFFALSNDPDFGQSGKVDSMDQAILLFPSDWINEKAISLALCRHFIQHNFGHSIDRQVFSVHSLVTAQVMREIGKLMEIRPDQKSVTYILGLLHDLSKLLLDTGNSRDYEEVLRQAKKGSSLPAAEREVFDLSSQRIWAHALKEWKLPMSLLKMYKGTVTGKVQSNMRALIGTSSRIAEMLGANLIKGFADRSPLEKSNILPLLTGDNLLQISETVKKEMDPYCRVLDLPLLDLDQLVYSLFDTAHHLSRSNAKRAKVQRKLALKAKELETLTFVFTRIMKSLEGESLSFSVLEAFMAGFSCDYALMLNCGPRGSFNGYMATFESEEQSAVHVVELNEDQLSPSMKKSIKERSIVKVDNLTAEEGKLSFLGDASEVWLAPACMGERVRALIGVGFKSHKENDLDVHFEELLGLLASEIGLSVENARLFKMICKEAGTDYLTDLDNRRNLIQVLQAEYARFKRGSVPVSVALFDLDYFKTINDNFGHLAGDMLLMKIAEVLKNGVRKADHVGRYGGDEFIAVFPDTRLEDAVEVVERIRQDVMEITLEYKLPILGDALSVSIGVAEAEADMTRFDDLLNAADCALYKAKDSGRNCCLY